MDPTPEPAATHVPLPVLPTGRAEALAHATPDPAVLPPAYPTSSGVAAAEPASAEPAAAAPAPDPTKAFELKLLEGRVIEACSQIYDPEIPVNIYELGLIYRIDVREDKTVKVQMTLTAPACPVAGTLPGEVEKKIESIPEVKSAEVELVWDPPWSRDKMSEAAQLTLGLM
ncbi:MAG TPA: SUF system Fe-S cluster assembly protein [Humisphaera sp.]